MRHLNSYEIGRRKLFEETSTCEWEQVAEPIFFL
jgi:hypothetical protein